MKIYRIALLESDMEKIYDGLEDALKYLEQDYIGKTKNEIKKALKGLEKIKPYLKQKDKPTASGFIRKK